MQPDDVGIYLNWLLLLDAQPLTSTTKGMCEVFSLPFYNLICFLIGFCYPIHDIVAFY